MIKYLTVIIIILGACSCSQFSKSPTSVAWHNLNAKYNALLIAKEDFKIAKEFIQLNANENFETTLPIFIKIDSNKLDSAKLFLIDAIKKSSIVAERHSNSKYLDEAYLILGKSRLLKQETFNAIETFKYVNTTAKNPNSKNEGLIWLMRAYIENEDLFTANQVAELLKNEKLEKNNRNLFLITKAYYHQKLNENALSVVFLEEGLKKLPKSAEKARLHFIAGQMYDKLNQPVLARKNYISSLKNKPSFELEFNANLGLMMNQSLAKNTNAEFELMLENRKNQDLKDKIYFKMGELEAKKNNFEKAISYFSLSVANATTNMVQKAYSYKAIGDIYFDNLNEFEKAATYYDSTLITIPKDFEEYKNLSLRALSLNDFNRYKKALDLEDSLQVLAAMNPLELDHKIEQMILDKKKKEEVSKSEIKTTASVNFQGIPGEKRWELYDPVESLKLQNEFVRIWGNRKLEDNWRRTEKEIGSFSLKIERNIDVAEEDKKLQAQNKSAELEAEMAKKQEIEKEKEEILKKIPKSQIQLIASKRKQEEAYFNLGKIYKLQFNDNKKAEEMFKSLIANHAGSVYEPEALYFLALMSQDINDNQYAKILNEKHPYSSFARQLKKGNIKLSEDMEASAQASYANAFRYFENNDYQSCLNILEENLNKYTGSQIEDKMALLRLLSLSKLGNKNQYVVSLNDFIRSYPTSTLVPKARQMLSAVNK